MLQIHFIRENKEEVITRLAKKNFDATAVVELVVELDEKRRNTQVELDNLLAESNKLSKDIGEMMKNGEKAKAEILKEKTTQIRENSKQLNESLHYWKESFGARTIVQNFYEIETKNYPLLENVLI